MKNKINLSKIFLAVTMILITGVSPVIASETVSSDITKRMEVAAQSAEKNSKLGRLTTRLFHSLKTYEGIRDYRALFVKRERVSSGKLGEKESIYLYFDKPFRVFMKWLDTGKKGLQVCYARGKHSNKLGIHKPGLFLGLAPIVFLDQNSPWVKEGSESYNIEDAGIGTFLTDFSKAVLQASEEGKLDVEFSDFGDQRALVTFKDSQKSSVYFAYKINVFFDAQTQLPTRMELYDWQMKLMGIYSYGNLHVNAGAEDKSFTGEIHKQLYKAYF